jgi:hypothetical protein
MNALQPSNRFAFMGMTCEVPGAIEIYFKRHGKAMKIHKM